MLSFIVSFLKKHRDQESGQSSLTQAQERQKGASPSKRHRGNCIGPAYTSCLQPPPKQTAKHFSGMDVRVINQGLRQQSRTLNTEATWEGAAQRDVLCCRTGGSPVRHGSLSRGGGGGRGSVGDEPLLAGKCYLKVSYTHQQVNGRSHIFVSALPRTRQPKGFVMRLGRKDGLHLMVERLGSFFTQCWFYHMETHWQNLWFSLRTNHGYVKPPCSSKEYDPLWGEGYQPLTPPFQAWWTEETHLSTGEQLKQNKAFNLWPSAFCQRISHRKSQEPGAKDGVDCQIVSEPYRKSSFLLCVRWFCVQDPPHLWAKTFSNCCWRDLEHLLEATSSNRKFEAVLWEKKKREQCLLLMPNNGTIIKISGRASCPLRAWMNDHYVHDGGRLSVQSGVNSEKCYLPLCV